MSKLSDRIEPSLGELYEAWTTFTPLDVVNCALTPEVVHKHEIVLVINDVTMHVADRVRISPLSLSTWVLVLVQDRLVIAPLSYLDPIKQWKQR